MTRADSINLTAKSSMFGPCKVLFDIILRFPFAIGSHGVV